MAVDWTIFEPTEDEIALYKKYLQNGGTLDFWTWRNSWYSLSPTTEGVSSTITTGPALPTAPTGALADTSLAIPLPTTSTTPTLADIEAGRATSTYKIVIPDQIWYDPKTGKYWMKVGAGLVEIKAADAMYFLEEYNKGYETPVSPEEAAGIELQWYVPGAVVYDPANGKYYYTSTGKIDEASMAEITPAQAQTFYTEAYSKTVAGTTAAPKTTAPPEHGGGTIAEVVSEGGYDYQIYRDAQGIVRDKVMIGPTATTAPARGTTTPTTFSLPPGSPQTYTDANGSIWNWDANQGRYVESGFDPSRVWQPPAAPSAPPEHRGGAIAEVVSEGGYDYQIYRAGGQVVDKVMIGRTEQKGRDWQQGAEANRLAEDKRQFDILQAEKTAETARQPELQRQINELQWERDRIQLLSGLPSDDWISRYTLQNTPNPYTVEKKAPETNYGLIGKKLDEQTAMVQQLEAGLAKATLQGASEWITGDFEKDLVEAKAQRDATYKIWKGMKDEMENWTPQVPQPYPNAPEWLPKYAPGQTAGRMITPQNMPTPSGQQLVQMSPSQAGQLGYYADWTAKRGGGRNWRDILGEANLMQPFTPRGAGQSRWSPVRQGF